MRLVAAHVRKVMSVHDSGRLDLDDGVTTIVGKNESGKTAVLQALYRGNPLPSGHVTAFTKRRDYPRADVGRDRDAIDGVRPITLEVELDDDDRDLLAGIGLRLDSPTLFASRRYGDELLHWSLEENGSGPMEGAGPEVLTALGTMLPGFQYFDDHNVLPGSVSIRRLQELDPSDLYPSERTALALLRLAGVAGSRFDEADYEARKAALEAAAARLTDQLLEYWSQNQRLSIELDLETLGSADPWMHIRVRDDSRRMSLNVTERSKGFIWFFSFLAAFSEYADQERRVILLDEPGMNLHANAQVDLMRYVKERLGPFHQVVYSTHSPYLIDSTRLDRCRVLENHPETGTRVVQDVWEAGTESTVPLLAALGADLVRRFVDGPDQLLVSSPSDVAYLTVVGDHLRTRGGRALDPRWTITPVGGASGLPTILALLGTSTVAATVLLDGPADQRGAVEELVRRGAIEGSRLVPLTDITGTEGADLEDLFDSRWYLALLEDAGLATVPHRKLVGRRFFRTPPRRRVVEQLTTLLGGRYDRFQPAGHLLRYRSAVLDTLDAGSVQRFQQLIDRLNGLLD